MGLPTGGITISELHRQEFRQRNDAGHFELERPCSVHLNIERAGAVCVKLFDRARA